MNKRVLYLFTFVMIILLNIAGCNNMESDKKIIKSEKDNNSKEEYLIENMIERKIPKDFNLDNITKIECGCEDNNDKQEFKIDSNVDEVREILESLKINKDMTYGDKEYNSYLLYIYSYGELAYTIKILDKEDINKVLVYNDNYKFVCSLNKEDGNKILDIIHKEQNINIFDRTAPESIKDLNIEKTGYVNPNALLEGIEIITDKEKITTVTECIENATILEDNMDIVLYGPRMISFYTTDEELLLNISRVESVYDKKRNVYHISNDKYSFLIELSDETNEKFVKVLEVDTPHGSSSGYLPHCHHPNYRNAHCWFPL